jgi:hypothetical protein
MTASFSLSYLVSHFGFARPRSSSIKKPQPAHFPASSRRELKGPNHLPRSI